MAQHGEAGHIVFRIQNINTDRNRILHSGRNRRQKFRLRDFPFDTPDIKNGIHGAPVTHRNIQPHPGLKGINQIPVSADSGFTLIDCFLSFQDRSRIADIGLLVLCNRIKCFSLHCFCFGKQG